MPMSEDPLLRSSHFPSSLNFVFFLHVPFSSPYLRNAISYLWPYDK